MQLELNSDTYQQQGASEFPPNSGALTSQSLSFHAITLLRAAVTDRKGQIIHVKDMGGESIQANDQNFIEDASPRSAALWVSALEELVGAGLVKDAGYKGQVYAVTNDGYQGIERLESLMPLQVELIIDGKPPNQVLNVRANKSVEVTRISYAFSSNGAAVAADQVAGKGAEMSFPINNEMLLALWNAPRPDKAYSDHAGPAGLVVLISDGVRKHELTLPVLMDAVNLNNTHVRRLTGSKSFSVQGHA